MSLADKITELNDGLLDAYDAIAAKGGTIPAQKNLNNLPAAIQSTANATPTNGVALGGLGDEQVMYTPYTQDGETTHETYPLTATVSPEDASNKEVVFTSNDPSIVDIHYNAATGDYAAEALSNGQAVITARTVDGNFTDTCVVTAKTHAESVSIEPAGVTAILDMDIPLTAIVLPEETTDKSVVWESSDTSIATVSQVGVVHTIAEGNVTITATTVDGGHVGTCEIIVNDMPVDWPSLQSAVRAGKAERYYSVGDEITFPCTFKESETSTQYNMPWIVVAFKDVEKEGSSETVPGMVLQAKYAFPSNYPLDAAENQVVATEETAQEGLYYYGRNSSTYTALNLAVGDTIPYDNYEYVYKSEIGKADSTDINFLRYGYNRWSHSGLRQYLNSSAPANEWWRAQHIGDVAPNYANKRGFLACFNSDFVNVLTPVKIATSKNTVTDDGETEYTYDKMFLPSKEEMYFAPQVAGAEGPYWQYWKDKTGLDAPSDSTNAGRSIYRVSSQSSASSVWLRSANRSSSGNVWYDNSSGNAGNFSAYNGYYVAPACVIC